jgi:chromosome segregation ATPase
MDEFMTNEQPPKPTGAAREWTFRIDKLYDCSLRMTPITDDDVEVLVLKSAYVAALAERDEWRHEAQLRADSYGVKCAEVTGLKAELEEIKSSFTTDAQIDRAIESIKEAPDKEWAIRRMMATLEHHFRFHHGKEKSLQEEISALKEQLAAAHIDAGRGIKECHKRNTQIAQLNEKCDALTAENARLKLHLTALLETTECRGDEDCDHCQATLALKESK